MKSRQAILMAACICLFSGCRTARPTGQSQTGFLDQNFIHPGVQQRVQEAERDLPDDKWQTAVPGAKKSAGTWNQTRRDREASLAQALLNQIQPGMNHQSVTDLLASLKTYPQFSDLLLTGVASCYYDRGNQMVIEELRKRPKRELSCLRQHFKDKRRIYQENGPYSSVGALCQLVLDQTD
jgi:hypothetical protein